MRTEPRTAKAVNSRQCPVRRFASAPVRSLKAVSLSQNQSAGLGDQSFERDVSHPLSVQFARAYRLAGAPAHWVTGSLGHRELGLLLGEPSGAAAAIAAEPIAAVGEGRHVAFLATGQTNDRVLLATMYARGDTCGRGLWARRLAAPPGSEIKNFAHGFLYGRSFGVIPRPIAVHATPSAWA